MVDFDAQTATISVRGGIQREGEKQNTDYTEGHIRAIADQFQTLEIELYKLPSNIEHRRGDHDIDENDVMVDPPA